MTLFWSLALAWFSGIVSGFIVSIPVGPINITIINDGYRRGFLWSVLVGTGAMTMEMVYCGIAFAGFAGLFESDLLRAAMELVSFLLMLFLGIKYLLSKDIPEYSRSVEKVEMRLHPHTAFMTGFVRVLGNPAVLLFWITVTGTLVAHAWLEDDWRSKLACVVGVGVGGFAWFTLLSYGVSLGKGKFSKQTLIRMSHVSGGFLLLVAVVLGLRIIYTLAQHRPP